MRRSTDRILTTHVGALPTPPGLWKDGDVDAARLRMDVADIVHRQVDCGVDIVNEGELTKGGKSAPVGTTRNWNTVLKLAELSSR